MGTFKQGILGGFSGKVGTVVGSYWKGRNVMRALPRSYNDPKSEVQLTQRMRFSLASKFLMPLLPVIQVGYQAWRSVMTERNAAMSQILTQGTTGVYPNVVLNYDDILLAQGPLSAGTGIMVSENAGKVQISWEDDSAIGNASSKDSALVALVNTTTHDVVLSMNSALREDEMVELILPVHWSGQTVECYLGFVSADGKVVSNCVNIGNVVVG